MDCSICYFTFSSHKQFHELQCCKNNLICLHCVELLLSPVCPFCRAPMPHLSYKNPKLLSSSVPTTSTIYWNDLQLNPFDDVYTDSRILRRQMKRIRKLQERERQRLYNQQLNIVLKQSKTHLKREIDNHIKEDYDSYLIFDYDS